jgi:hypothetical protein
MSQKFYDEEEAEAILRLAAQRSSFGGMSKERLLSTAAELGIAPEAVEEAERLVGQHRQDLQLRAEFDKKIRKEFLSHAISYVAVNGFLVVLNLATSPHEFWAIWPIMSWGLALALHFATTYFKGSDDYDEEYEKWKAKRDGRLSGKGSATDLVQEWLALYPGDTKGAARYVRDNLNIDKDSANSLAGRYRV